MEHLIGIIVIVAIILVYFGFNPLKLFPFWKHLDLKKEEFEAKRLWNIYARNKLIMFKEKIRNRNISIEYQSRYQGTRQAAMVLKCGLEDFGVNVLGSEDDFDVKIGIKRYSHTDGMFIITNKQGQEITRVVVHHEYLISSIIEKLAEYFEQTTPIH